MRVHTLGRGATHGAATASTLARLDLVALNEATCARCHTPFPVPVRTGDALHLAAACFLREQAEEVEFATYDARLAVAAGALGFRMAPLD